MEKLLALILLSLFVSEYFTVKCIYVYVYTGNSNK